MNNFLIPIYSDRIPRRLRHNILAMNILPVASGKHGNKSIRNNYAKYPR